MLITIGLMKKVPVLIGVLGIVIGLGLTVVSDATAGFHACSSGGGGQPARGIASATPCSAPTDVLDIAGFAICILAVLAALAVRAVISRRAQRRSAPPPRAW